nr:hypothetical protein [Fusobacterium gastrosuis]
MIVKKIQNRDDWRKFVTKINKEAGVVFNAGKLHTTDACKGYIVSLVKKLREEITIAKKELAVESMLVEHYSEEKNKIKEKCNKLEVEIANADNCKALYKEIDKLNEEIEFKNKEISINKENIKALNSKITELRKENFEQSNFKAGFILEAQNNKTELELQKLYKKSFAGALVVSVIINILLVWGNV